jgi:hypothetical protein
MRSSRWPDEISWAAMATDDRCLYLHVGESISYRMRPLWKGRPMPNQALQLRISQYTFTAQDPPNPPSQLVIKTLVPVPSERLHRDAAGQPIVCYGRRRIHHFHRYWFVAGAAMLRYQAPGDNFNPNQDGSNAYHYFGFVSYNIFRVLPNDNYDHVPDSQITWDFVYQNVIRYFYLIYPGMFARLAFQNEDHRQTICIDHREDGRQKRLGQHFVYAGFARSIGW